MKFRLNHYLFYQLPLVKNHFFTIVIGFILGVLIYIYLGLAKESNTELLLSGLLGIIIGYFITYCDSAYNQIISWKKYTGIRFFVGVLSHAFITILLILTALYGYMFFQTSTIPFIDTYGETILKLIILMFFVSLVYNVVYFAIHSYNQYVRGQIIELKLERKQTELQLAALKTQLSPHFLFNSINTISSLLFTDIKKTELFIRELAKSYQYTLNIYKNKWVTVEEELKFVNSYCYLLKTRFDDHITLKVTLPPQLLKTKIPPLTLQMLIENAVKHNQMTALHILKVDIGCENNYIKVSNNKTLKPKNISSFEIGLNNIRSRYELLANKTIEVIDAEQFIVKLPIII